MPNTPPPPFFIFVCIKFPWDTDILICFGYCLLGSLLSNKKVKIGRDSFRKGDSDQYKKIQVIQATDILGERSERQVKYCLKKNKYIYQKKKEKE